MIYCYGGNMPVRTSEDISLIMLTRLQRQIDEQRVRLNKAVNTQGKRPAYSFPSLKYDDLRYADNGMHSFNMRWVIDGRKAHEAANEGTGVFAYYDASSDTWRKLNDEAVQK